MEEVRYDLWGYPVTTKSDSCISHINSYYDQVLSYGANIEIIYKATEADQNCVIANTLCAHTAALKKKSSHAFHYLNAARSRLDYATPYEKMVFEAVTSLMEGDDEDVVLQTHSKLLNDFPKDMVSLKRLQVFCFYIGRPDLSLQMTEQVMPFNQGQNYIYGMLSFPMLEVGQMKDAELAARRALSINSDDPWSQHALCHVLQYEGKFKEASDFMEKCSKSWNFCSSFMYVHNWWHLALCYLEGNSDVSKVLDIYDNQILAALKKDDADCVQVYLNALGLLLNLHVHGHSSIISDRVRFICNNLQDKSLWNQEWLLDLLATWAFSYVGMHSEAKLYLESMNSRVAKMNTGKREHMKKVLMLAKCLYYYGKSDYLQAYNMLGSGFNVYDCKVMGASSEQVEVFEIVRWITLIKSGHTSEAIEALRQSISVRSNVPLTRDLLENAYFLEARSRDANGTKAASVRATK